MMKPIYLFCLVFIFFNTSFAQTTTPLCPNGQALAADNCQDVCIPCTLDQYVGNNDQMTPSAGVNFPCGTLDNDQWLAFIARGAQVSFTVTPGSCTQGDGLELAIYATCGAAPIACQPGQAGGGPLTITANVVAGQTYYLMIDGYNGDVCDYIVHVNNNSTIPPAWGLHIIQGPQWIAPLDTAVYSVGLSPQAVSYTWTAPLGATINGQPSPLTLPAPAGASVTIVAGSLSGVVTATGNGFCGPGPSYGKEVIVGLDIFSVCESNVGGGADNCVDKCVDCDLFPILGSTSGYTPDGPNYPGCGLAQHNNQWYSFIAGTSSATFEINSSDCQNGDGVQLLLMETCYGEVIPFGCLGGVTGGADIPQSTTVSLTIGQEYLLMVDGYIGDICDFTVTVNPPQAGKAPPLLPVTSISGASTVCAGGTFTYSVPNNLGTTRFAWTLPPGAFATNADPLTDSPYWLGGSSIEVVMGTVGGEICATPISACQTGAAFCKNIQLVNIPPTLLPDVIVCAEDAPYELPWGDFASSSGIYSHIYVSVSGCDSLVRQKVTIKPPIVVNLATKYLCAGGSITVCGETYNQAGIYTQVCESWQGCDSTVTFSLVIMNPVADIISSNPIISCSQPTVCLNSAPSQGLKIWRNINGTALGSGNTLCVTTPGIYTLTVTATTGGVSCTASDTIVVTSNIPNPLPVATASGGEITCTTPCIMLSGSSSVPASYAWTGPGGYTSTVANPTVCLPGLYTLTITGNGNGCTATATATITADQAAPAITSIQPPELNCSTPTGQMVTFSAAPDLLYTWTGPNGFNSSEASPLIAQAGTYQLVVTQPGNGCSAGYTVEVPGDFVVPVLNAQGATISCQTPQPTISCSSSLLNVQYSWAGPGGFSASIPAPTVQDPGEYTATVTASNGCTASATVVVTEDLFGPTVFATCNVLNCQQTTAQIQLLAFPNTINWTYAWVGPNGFTSSEAQPMINAPGLYSVTLSDPASPCTATGGVLVVQNITPIDHATASALGQLTCNQLSVILEGTSSDPTALYSWTGPNNFSAYIESPVVQYPGDYILTATHPVSLCTAMDTVTVGQAPDVPVIVLQAPLIDCAHPEAIVQTAITPASAHYTYAWNGPGNFQSTLPEPVVTVPGAYQLLLTDTLTGCQAGASINVAGDLMPPNLSASGGVLNCNTPQVLLDGASTTDNVSFVWTGPDGESVTVEDVLVSVPGLYTLVATTLNGCTETVQVQVNADFTTPVGTATALPDVDQQGIGQIQLAISSGTGPFVVQWYLNGQLVSEAEDPDSLYAGTYMGIITGANGCQDSLEVVLDNISGTAQAFEHGFWQVFPNPTSQWLTLRYQGDLLPEVQVQVLDMTGRLLLDQHFTYPQVESLDLSSIPSGACVLRLRAGQQQATLLISKVN
jgi:hypothetical protein